MCVYVCESGSVGMCLGGSGWMFGRVCVCVRERVYLTMHGRKWVTETRLTFMCGNGQSSFFDAPLNYAKETCVYTHIRADDPSNIVAFACICTNIPHCVGCCQEVACIEG